MATLLYILADPSFKPRNRPRQQPGRLIAEAHAKALAEAMNTELVKKSDLSEFRAEVKGQFELLKWMLGFMLAGTVAILFKIFH